MRYLTVLSTAFILLSCSREDGSAPIYEAPVFPTESHADIHVLDNDMPIANASQIMLYDSVAIVKAQSLEDKTAFQILSLDKAEHIGGFGYEGRGESELLDYYFRDINRLDNSFVAIDTKGKVARFDLKKILAGETNILVESYNLPKFATGIKMDCRGDRLLFMQGRPRFCITDMHGRDTSAVYKELPMVTPQIDRDTMTQFLYFTYCSSYAAKPDGTRFVNATRTGMIMEIFDVKSDRISPVTTRYLYQPKIEESIKAAESCICGTIMVDATDRYIYVLYRDTPVGDTTSNAVLGVFDWDAKEVCKYTFDTSVYIITPSPDDRRVYCWGLQEDGYEYFGYFDLSGSNRGNCRVVFGIRSIHVLLSTALCRTVAINIFSEQSALGLWGVSRSLRGGRRRASARGEARYCVRNRITGSCSQSRRYAGGSRGSNSRKTSIRYSTNLKQIVPESFMAELGWRVIDRGAFFADKK